MKINYIEFISLLNSTQNKSTMFGKFTVFAMLAFILAFSACNDPNTCANGHTYTWTIVNNEHKGVCTICGKVQLLSFSDFYGTWHAEDKALVNIDGTWQVVSSTVIWTISNEKVRISHGKGWWELTMESIQAVTLSEINSHGYTHGFALNGTSESFEDLWTWNLPIRFLMNMTNDTMVINHFNPVSPSWIFTRE